ncbi:SPFH domain-containing protein [Sinomonas susongensis]|uniref:SPFH domain-containing protein n=1 Tax=Sinomonas susongensis TaxID=1324851 RepID=UPI001108E93B|nr:SPFH domain-containing protein [Sinomonas susongensis]
MDVGGILLLVVVIALILFVATVIGRSVRIIPQARAGVVERLGKYQRTLNPGLTLLIPFVDRLLPLLDLREQVVSFPPQPVITSDNLVVSIDTVVYFQVTDPRAATYEIANYIQAVEQLTITTLRNVVGGLNLEEALTSRDQINGQLRGVLDEATGRWGLRVSRVELKAIEPPHSIQDSMEKQMRAERDRRALILTAEGTKQSAILTAEGERQAQILKAEGQAKAAVLKADGESQAIQKVFEAIHLGDPDPKLLAYQYLQTLPKIADGNSNKLWIIPSEVGDALKGIGGVLGNMGQTSPDTQATTSGEPDGSSATPRKTQIAKSRGLEEDARAFEEEAARRSELDAEAERILQHHAGVAGLDVPDAEIPEPEIPEAGAPKPGVPDGGIADQKGAGRDPYRP